MSEKNVTKTVTPRDIINTVANDTGRDAREVKTVYGAFMDEILTRLYNNENVQLTSFLKFELIDRPERDSRNPITGEYVHVPPRRFVKLSRLKDLNDITADLNEEGKPIREGEARELESVKRRRGYREKWDKQLREKDERRLARERRRAEHDVNKERAKNERLQLVVDELTARLHVKEVEESAQEKVRQAQREFEEARRLAGQNAKARR